MQGALNLFDAKTKFKMSFFETRLHMELDASPLEFGRIKVCLTCSRLMFTACAGEHKVYRVIDKEEELIQVGGWRRRRRRRRSTKKAAKIAAKIAKIAAQNAKKAAQKKRSIEKNKKNAKNAKKNAKKKKKNAKKKKKKSAKNKNLDASADEYEDTPANEYQAAADTKVVRYDRTKGPFFKLDADLATTKFDMEFNAYAIVCHPSSYSLLFDVGLCRLRGWAKPASG